MTPGEITDTDIIYLYKVMKTLDRKDLKKGIIKEVNNQVNNWNLSTIHTYEVPSGTPVLMWVR